MLRAIVAAAAYVIAGTALAQPTRASLEVVPGAGRPAAEQLFERDWVLMNWALKFYDSNHDVLLDAREAQNAADEFRQMADTNRDGRVTPQEYRFAREFILARY